jgi:hypothetical protein
MDDVKDLLRRVVESELPSTGLERVRASVVRRRRRQRATAGGLAVLIAVVGIGLAIRTFSGSSHGGQPVDETPTEVGPLDISTLAPSWSADVPTGVGLFAVVADAERVYVPTTSGVVAYAKACDDPCAPLWTLEMGDVAPGQNDHVQVAVGDGVVAVVRGGLLAVVPADCAAVCHPLWTARSQGGGYVGPLISSGVVKVSSGEGEGDNQHVTAVAFPVDCRNDGAECSPAWTGDMGLGTQYAPGEVIDGVFYQRIGATMWGFAAGCRSDGGPCGPDFSTRVAASSQGNGVAVHEGQLVLAPGDGMVYGFAEHCGDSCAPLWVAPVSGSLSAPTLAGDAVVFSDDQGLVALPLPCSDPCRPLWTADLGGYWGIDYADANVIVVTERLHGDPEIAVLPTDCAERCEPTWSTTLDQKIYGVASDGVHVFVAVGEEVRAYPIECSDFCEPVWTGAVSGETWWLLLDGSRLVAASRAGGVFEEGISLTAFVSSSSAAQRHFARFFFAASGVWGVLEVQTSPPGICYETQSFPARPIEIVSNPPVEGRVTVVASYSPPRGTYCDRSVSEAITRDIIDNPSGYAISWRPDPSADTATSRLTPQG